MLSTLREDLREPRARWVVTSLLLGGRHRAVFLYRVSAWCARRGLSPLAMLAWSLNVALHGCDISPRARIGPGFKLAHTVGVVLGPIVAGSHLLLYQNVTIGALDERDGPREWPRLGDGVVVGAGAVLLGGIGVGDGARIGANAVVLRDVPARYTAVGVPARLIPAASAARPTTLRPAQLRIPIAG